VIAAWRKPRDRRQHVGIVRRHGVLDRRQALLERTLCHAHRGFGACDGIAGMRKLFARHGRTGTCAAAIVTLCLRQVHLCGCELRAQLRHLGELRAHTAHRAGEIGFRRLHRNLRLDGIEFDQKLTAPHALCVVAVQRSTVPFSRLVIDTTSPPT